VTKLTLEETDEAEAVLRQASENNAALAIDGFVDCLYDCLEVEYHCGEQLCGLSGVVCRSQPELFERLSEMQSRCWTKCSKPDALA